MNLYGKSAWLAVILLLAAAAHGTERIANSKHDLSVSSPHPIRAIDEERICVFCHTPHNAEAQSPLWNRHSPTTHYRIYRSSTTDARIDQPSGTSKMCLSCHDGSLAVGLVRSRPATDPIAMTVHTLPPGRANLTNDLSDDHPIGFRYDRALSNVDSQLRDAQMISSKLSLGPHSEVNCATCHDPHNNELGDFLRLPLRRGVLCTSCHKMLGWNLASHAHSERNIRNRLIDPRNRPEFASLADNSCLACHQVHGAAGRERLLRFRIDEDNCLTCHDGSAGADILSVVRLPSNHRSRWWSSRHDPTENPRTMVHHVQCVDCHNPHAAGSVGITLGPSRGGTLSNTLRAVPGVDIRGRNIRRVRQEYEVCLRCHGDNPVRIRGQISRVGPTVSLRRKIAPAAASSHPIVLPGRSSEVPSLVPGLAGRTMNCTDCHNSNNARSVGGTGPEGPHGSVFDFLLAQRYETRDFTSESAAAYALCYRCHNRSSILGNESFALHQRHIVRGQAPCSACHDPHGVTGSRTAGSHLINFDRSIVTRSPLDPRIEFEDRGRFKGSCTLKCHGVNHINFQYTPATPP